MDGALKPSRLSYSDGEELAERLSRGVQVDPPGAQSHPSKEKEDFRKEAAQELELTHTSEHEAVSQEYSSTSAMTIEKGEDFARTIESKNESETEKDAVEQEVRENVEVTSANAFESPMRSAASGNVAGNV